MIDKFYRNKIICRAKLRDDKDTFVDGLKLINNPLFDDFNDNFEIKKIFNALSVIRHKIVHDYGQLTQDDINDNIFFEHFFSFQKSDEIWKIEMPKNQYSHALRKLLEFALMVRNFLKYKEKPLY